MGSRESTTPAWVSYEHGRSGNGRSWRGRFDQQSRQIVAMMTLGASVRGVLQVSNIISRLDGNAALVAPHTLSVVVCRQLRGRIWSPPYGSDGCPELRRYRGVHRRGRPGRDALFPRPRLVRHGIVGLGSLHRGMGHQGHLPGDRSANERDVFTSFTSCSGATAAKWVVFCFACLCFSSLSRCFLCLVCLVCLR